MSQHWRESRTNCVVCGSHDVMRDEVLDAGLLHLAECRRCEHRWTWRGLDVSSLSFLQQNSGQAPLRASPRTIQSPPMRPRVAAVRHVGQFAQESTEERGSVA